MEYKNAPITSSEYKSQFRKIISLMLVVFLSVFIVACAREEANFLEDFTLAIEAEDFAGAYDVYEAAEDAGNYPLQDFIEIVELEIEQVVEDYNAETLTYDEANLKIQSLSLGADFESHVSESLEVAANEIRKTDGLLFAMDNANIYMEAEDYQHAIVLYEEILINNPDYQPAINARIEAIEEFSNQTIEEVGGLLENGLNRSALVNVETALAFDPNNTELQGLKTEIEVSIAAKEEEIQDVALNLAVQEMFESGSFTEIEDFLADLQSKGVDTAEYEARLEEAITNYIDTAISEARNLAGELGSGHWESNPYSDAINRINQALALFPDNESLQNAKSNFENSIPDNIADDIFDTSGNVHNATNGTDANGYEYDSSAFNRAIYTRPDSSFKFNNGSYGNVRLLVTAQSENPSVYSGMIMTILIDGEVRYEQEIFTSESRSMLFEYELPEDPEVEIRLVQSGFASFFDRILGLNGIYIEGFRY